MRYKGTSENLEKTDKQIKPHSHKVTNGQTQKIKVKSEGSIVFVFLCFVFYLSLAVQLCTTCHKDVLNICEMTSRPHCTTTEARCTVMHV